MQYLVTGDHVEPGPLLPPGQLAGTLRQLVLPSHDALADLKAEGRLLNGGYTVAQRAGAFIFEVDHNEELDAMLRGLSGAHKVQGDPARGRRGQAGSPTGRADRAERSITGSLVTATREGEHE